MSFQNAKQTIFEEQTASLQAAVQSRVFEVEVLTRLRGEQAALISGNYLPRQLRTDGHTGQSVIANIQEHLESTLQSLKSNRALTDVDRTAGRATFIELIEIADIHGTIVASTDRARSGGSIRNSLMRSIESEANFFGGYVFDEIAQQYFLMFASSIENFDSNEFSGAVLLYIQPGILEEITEGQFGSNSSEQVLIVGQDNQPVSEENYFVVAGAQQNGIHLREDPNSADQYPNPEFFGREYSGTITKDQNGVDVLAVSSEIEALNWTVVGKVDAGGDL